MRAHMKIKRNKVYAVLTGDVVASTRLSASRRQALHGAMSMASRTTRQAFGKQVPADVDVFRGDGWQMLVAEPEAALRIALFYRAQLRAAMESHRLDTRTVIGIGTVDFIPGRRVSQGDGAAYRRSGQGLESLARTRHMHFVYPELPEEEALQIIVQLVDRMATGWSEKQALAITGALQGWTQDQIGHACWPNPISQQAIAQHLDRAGWASLERTLVYVESVIGAFVKDKQAN